MNDDKKSKAHTHSTDIKFDTSLREWILSGIVGVTSGIIATAAGIRKEFGEEVKNRPGFQNFKVAAKDAGTFKNQGFKELCNKGGMVTFQGLLPEHQEALVANDMKYLLRPNSWREHAAETRSIKTKFAERRANFIKTGYETESKGFWNGIVKGTLQRKEFLGPSTRHALVFAGVSTAVIIGVTTLGLFNGVATRNKTNRIEDAVGVTRE